MIRFVRCRLLQMLLREHTYFLQYVMLLDMHQLFLLLAPLLQIKYEPIHFHSTTCQGFSTPPSQCVILPSLQSTCLVQDEDTFPELIDKERTRVGHKLWQVLVLDSSISQHLVLPPWNVSSLLLCELHLWREENTGYSCYYIWGKRAGVVTWPTNLIFNTDFRLQIIDFVQIAS